MSEIVNINGCRVLFIHVPRTGGTSISSVFGIKNRHSAIGCYCKSDYDFSFAFVRNPLSRLASAYYYLCGGGINAIDKKTASRHIGSLTFKEFVVGKISNKKDRVLNKWHIKPQYKWIVQNGIVSVDYVGRFENLWCDFSAVCKKLGIKPRILPHNNKSKKINLKEEYDGEMVSVIRNAYAEDFELFNYSVEI